MEASKSHRRMHHWVLILNRMEIEIEKYKANLVQEEDVSMWKNEKGRYKKVFSTRGTWHTIREKHQICNLHRAVWFKYATPKYSFILWTEMHG